MNMRHLGHPGMGTVSLLVANGRHQFGPTNRAHPGLRCNNQRTRCRVVMLVRGERGGTTGVLGQGITEQEEKGKQRSCFAHMQTHKNNNRLNNQTRRVYISIYVNVYSNGVTTDEPVSDKL